MRCSRQLRTILEKQALKSLKVDAFRHVAPETLALLCPLGRVHLKAKVHVDAERLVILRSARVESRDWRGWWQ